MSKGVIKQIFNDHWDRFVELYGPKIRRNVYAEVRKMIKCGTMEDGFIEFKCEACGEVKRVGFTCKSRFCTSCGKVYVDNWVESMTTRLFRVTHRHMVFTIPEELRVYFQRDRSLLQALPKCAAEVIKSWVKERNKKAEEYMPGMVTVIHTFGRDLKWNPHVHMIVTEGAAGNNNAWKPIKWFPFNMLRMRWQKLLLDELQVKIKSNIKEFKKLRDSLYKKLDNGFYVYGKGLMKTVQGAARYVGRYTGRPAIAESRIMNYDGQKVRYYYERHEDGKRVEVEIDALEFIKKIIIHIPEKHFKMVRYYGAYARNNRHKNKLFKLVSEKVADELKKLRKWKYRILKHFGIDPLKCSNCGANMVFHDIYYSKYGSVKDIIKKRSEREAKQNIQELMDTYRVIKGISYGKIEPLFAS